MIAELREEMQKLSNYEAAQQRLKDMEALEEDGKGAQVTTTTHPPAPPLSPPPSPCLCYNSFLPGRKHNPGSNSILFFFLLL